MGDETPGVGLGVRWEGNLVYQHFYDAGSSNSKFIPVVLEKASRQFVPIPLKGATIYALDTERGYEELYARLAEVPLTPKPPLGKRPSLPVKPVKTNPAMYVMGPIDVDLWNRAKWKAVFFIGGGGVTPGLGLAFENEAAARMIFEGWHERYGTRDLNEELRISFIEGDLPGEEPGYSVHISADIDVFKNRLKSFGYAYDDDDIVFSISRIHRMNPPAESRNLAQFKEMCLYHKTYFLLPGVILADESVKPIPELRILKSKVVFRDIADLGSNDPDSVVLGPLEWQARRDRER